VKNVIVDILNVCDFHHLMMKKIDLDSEEDKYVHEWFYDHKPLVDTK